MKAYPVCTISGSMRYFQHMLDYADQLSLDGWIVLMPFVVFRPGQEQTSANKKLLDNMHFAKINMSERVFVVSGVDGYYGESTQNEIAHALSYGVPVTYVRVSPITSEFIEWDGLAA